MARVYKIEEGGLHDRFQKSRKKIQVFGGGFGNGKTTGAVVKALQLARDYPGSNGLIARSTYPKLNDTIRKEFIAWCPPAWIERKNLSQDNVIQLKNGTVINFRYIQQGGKSNESSTSNLLSATYDWIVVDQVEDPEITYKDFLDLMGRLRGQTTYAGEDTTMPSSGPRWMILMCNPTRNWVYRQLIKPVQDWNNGLRNNPDILIDENTGEPAIDLFEGSTYENASNLPKDFIQGLEMSYRGQMRKRFLMGEWGAYEGLVYQEYNQAIHTVDHAEMVRYFDMIKSVGGYNNIVEAYDHGIASPACYGLGFTDQVGNVFLMDGFYEKEQTVHELATGIKEVRKSYGIEDSEDNRLTVQADPAVFKRTTGNSRTVGTTVSTLFNEEGIRMSRANNDIVSGIAKVQSYLYIDQYHRHPFDEARVGAPRLYVSNKLSWFDSEISDYYWKKNSVTGDYEDLPMDRADHAMDMMKYLFTNRPRVATFRMPKPKIPPAYTRWRERDLVSSSSRNHRHGR